MQIRIGGGGRVVTRRVRTRRHTTLLWAGNEADSQMGSVRPHSQWKAKRTAYLAGQIISPSRSILLTFFRLSRGPDFARVTRQCRRHSARGGCARGGDQISEFPHDSPDEPSQRPGNSVESTLYDVSTLGEGAQQCGEYRIPETKIVQYRFGIFPEEIERRTLDEMGPARRLAFP